MFDGDCSMGIAKQKGGVADSHSVNAEMAPAAQAPSQLIRELDFGSPFIPSQDPTFLIEGRFFLIWAWVAHCPRRVRPERKCNQ